jgi:hypothetical protein
VRSRAHFFQTEIKVLMHSWKWTEVPIHYRNPSKSVGRSSLLDAVRNLARLVRQRFVPPSTQQAPATPMQPEPSVATAPISENAGGLVGVVTTVQPPTACLRELAQRMTSASAGLVVVGDRKGPVDFQLDGSEFIPLARQRELPFRLAAILPTGHYARKNLGYLLAISRGAACIYETDDDNSPNAHWATRGVVTRAQPVAPRPWMNVYRAFTHDHIWPRGFPLDRVTDPAVGTHEPATPQIEVHAPIQQGLADGAPDVDAVWRLVLDRPFTFRRSPSVWLPPGTWCPFNSQSTWWWPEAYPLLYLPSHCPFRMTDIWRSFVAQRCLWELGHGVVFHAPEVVQDRNPHDFLRDFKDEIPGYLRNHEIVARLSQLSLTPGRGAVGGNLIRCYEALVDGGDFPSEELPLVRAWVEDIGAASGHSRRAA